MNYFTTIEQFFLSLKDSGLALSASDYQLIGKWEERNIPLELICRAIESGYSRVEGQRHIRRRKTSLTQLQAIIEDKIQEEIQQQ